MKEEKAYLIRYILYSINNTIHFNTFSQYQNWLTVMEDNFDTFKVIEVCTYDV